MASQFGLVQFGPGQVTGFTRWRLDGLLRREWRGSRFGERAGQLGEDGQVGVQPDSVKPSGSEGE